MMNQKKQYGNKPSNGEDGKRLEEKALQQFETVDEWYLHTMDIMRKLDQLTRQYGLSFLQFNILIHLKQVDSSTNTDLADQLELSTSSVSRTLRILEKKEFIEKIYNEDIDQRVRRIKNTPAGDEIASKVNEAILHSNLSTLL